jgi:predicted transposase/invertase (TIGR01784 family)
VSSSKPDFIRKPLFEGKEQGREEGKREVYSSAVRRLLALGFSLEQIALCLGLSIEEVTQAAQ